MSARAPEIQPHHLSVARLLRRARAATLGLALLASAGCEEPAPTVTVAHHEVDLCDLREGPFSVIRVPCLIADLDTPPLVTTRAYIDGEQVGDSSSVGLFWIPIEKLPGAGERGTYEVTFKSRDEDEDGPPTVTTLQFEIPADLQAQVRERVEAARAREGRVAAARAPRFEITKEGNEFRTKNFGEFYGCYGTAYPPKFNDGKAVSLVIRKCPDTVKVNGERVTEDLVIPCEELWSAATKIGETGKVRFDVALEYEGQTFSGAVEADASACVDRVLRSKAGVRFPGEVGATPAKPRVIYDYSFLFAKGRDYGDITLGEVDWVVDRDFKTRRYDCHYNKVSTKRTESDVEVTIRDRRTGAKLHSKRFKAPKGRCDSKLSVKVDSKDQIASIGSGSDRMSTQVSDETIKRWLKGFLD